MSNLFERYKTEIILFTIALVIRGAYALLVQIVSGSHGFISHSDAEYFYFQSAKNLLYHASFSVATSTPYYPDAYHTPLYSLLVAALLAIRTPLFGIVLFQSIISSVTVVLTYRIGIQITKYRIVAIVAAILAMFEPMTIYWNALLMSDILFAFLITLSTWLLAGKRLFLSAFVLGLAILTRPIAMFFSPVFLCFAAYEAYQQRQSKSEIAKTLLLMTIIIALVMSPWLVRNKVTFNTWSMTSAGWYELYVAPLQEFVEVKDISLVPPRFAAENNITRFDFQYSVLYEKAFMQAVLQDPVGYVFIHIKRSLYSLVSNRYDYLLHVVVQSQVASLHAHIPPLLETGILGVGLLVWPIIYLLSIAAFARRELWPWLLFTAALVGINTGLSGAINPGGADMSRYAMPFYALLFAFTGIGFQIIYVFVLRVFSVFSTTR